MDTKLGTCNEGLYEAGSLKTVAKKLTQYKLDLMAVKEIRRDKDYSQPADNYTLSYGNGKANHHLGTGFFILHGTRSAIKRAKFIDDRMS
jgi:hypothetical protein